MSVTAGTVMTDVLTRIRDPNATACSSVTPPTTANGQAFVLSIMTYAQVFVSVGERLLVQNTADSVSPLSLTQHVAFQYLTGMPDFLKLAGSMIRDWDHHQVIQCDPRVFKGSSLSWYSDPADAIFGGGAGVPVDFAMLGLDKMFVVPVLGSLDDLVVYPVYYNYPTALTTTATLFSIPDDTTEHAAILTELVCRIKTRQLAGFQDRLKTLATMMQSSDMLANTGGKAD